MSIRFKIITFISILFTIGIGNTVLTFVLEKFSEEKLGWVNHTHEVINKIDHYLSAMTDAETGQRGFLLTKNVSYLEPYHRGIITAQNSYEELLSLVSDNPLQIKRLELINLPMKEKLSEMGQTINLIQDKSFDDAIAIVSQNSGKKLMDDIRLHLDAIASTEKALLIERKSNFRDHRTLIIIVIAVELTVFMFLAVISVLFLNRTLFSPLQSLLVNTHKMEKGAKLDIEDLTSKDEMGYLLSRFYKMNEIVHARTVNLTHEAHHDKLTGLLNRSNISDEIKSAIERSIESKKKCAIMFLDLNKFKELNDTMGHYVGDVILQKTASRLNDSIRKDDKVFRLGGDEFVVLVNNINSVLDIDLITSKISNAFKQPVTIQGKSHTISTSIGVSIGPDNSSDPDELLKYSDIAMYSSKKDSQSVYTLFDEGMLKRAGD